MPPLEPAAAPTPGAVVDGRIAEAAALDARYNTLPTLEVLDLAINDLFKGEIAVVSSFGTESAVLLHLVAAVDRSLPILFVDTEKLFGETLRYRDQLVARLGFTDVRTLTPTPARVDELDRDSGLWLRDADLCCQIRKVEPLAAGLDGFSAWISGRKRFQAATRAAIPVIEADGARIKVNPLATWAPKELAAYAAEHDLPAHPLIAQGYPSVGCMPCTDRVAPGEDARAGRWRGKAKTECGIHVGLGGVKAAGRGEN